MILLKSRNKVTSTPEKVIELFGEISGSLGDLTPGQRQELANLLDGRGEYLAATVELNKRRSALLRNYTPQGEQALKEFADNVVRPARDRLTPQSVSLLNQAVDTEKIEAMLPMLVLLLTQSVNLPLLFTTLGLDMDYIDSAIGKVSAYVKKGSS